MGLTAIDLVEEKDWPLLADHGLICSMGWKTGGGGIPDGLNDPRNHDAIVNGLIDALPAAAEGRRAEPHRLLRQPQGHAPTTMRSRTASIGLNRVKKAAEEHGITVCVELLNSKVDHKDYQGDRTGSASRW